MIIVSITGPRLQDARTQISASSRYADMFELRLDMIKASPRVLIALTQKPVIATCRPAWEGGQFRGSEGERIGILKTAADLGAAYVDLEVLCGKPAFRMFRAKGCRIIGSLHRFEQKSFDVQNIYRRLRSTNADVLKFAFTASDVSDIRHAFGFLEQATTEGQKAVAIAMGEWGEPSRILYRKFGGWATYASTEDGRNAAAGQVPASALHSLYRTEKISSRSRIFGVVGNPLKQSKGVYVHNPLFRRARIDAVYCRFPVKNLESFMRHIAPMLSGFSVTIPHKRRIMKYLDNVDATAGAIGAVNTVVRRGRKMVGTNTDAPGALDAIEKVVRVRNKRMLVFGAGGAARAIAYEAKMRGAIVHITNRTVSKAKSLAREFGLHFVLAEDIAKLQPAIIANATSLGMTPHTRTAPLPASLLRNAIVFDAVYNPPMTKLLHDAKEEGSRIIQGTEMYLNQALLQSALYTGKKPRRETLRKILEL